MHNEKEMEKVQFINYIQSDDTSNIFHPAVFYHHLSSNDIVIFMICIKFMRDYYAT